MTRDRRKSKISDRSTSSGAPMRDRSYAFVFSKEIEDWGLSSARKAMKKVRAKERKEKFNKGRAANL